MDRKVALKALDDYTKITHKNYSSLNSNDNKKIKYFKSLLSRILICIILVIAIAIYIKIDDDNASLVDKYLFHDNLKFTAINKWYQDKFGNVLPNVSSKDQEKDALVFSSNLLKNNYVTYKDGVQIDYQKGSPISLLYGGIVIFLGEKEDYGNVLVVQGNDGIDYTYGGLTNISINLYDYVEKDTIIGEASNDYIYLILEKNGQHLSYDEYLQEN